MIKREKGGRAFHLAGTFSRKRDAVACEEHWRKKGKRARRHLKGKEWVVFHD